MGFLRVHAEEEVNAVVGYVVFGWSFDGTGNTVPTAIGIIVAVAAVAWTLYSRVSAA